MAKKARRKISRQTDSASEDDCDQDPLNDLLLGFEWFDAPHKSRERSRIRRQMKALRELERRLDEKKLRSLIDDDWLYEQVPPPRWH
jgi:hypothetical protein